MMCERMTKIGWTRLGQPVFFDASDNTVCIELLQEGVLLIPQAAIILESVEPDATGLVDQLCEEGRCSLSTPMQMAP